MELNVVRNDGVKGEHLYLICMGRKRPSEEVRFKLRGTPTPRSNHEKIWRLNLPYSTVASTAPGDGRAFPTDWNGGQQG